MLEGKCCELLPLWTYVIVRANQERTLGTRKDAILNHPSHMISQKSGNDGNNFIIRTTQVSQTLFVQISVAAFCVRSNNCNHGRKNKTWPIKNYSKLPPQAVSAFQSMVCKNFSGKHTPGTPQRLAPSAFTKIFSAQLPIAMIFDRPQITFNVIQLYW